MAHQFPTRCGGLRRNLRIASLGCTARDGFTNWRRNGGNHRRTAACIWASPALADLLNDDGPRVLGNGWASAVHQEDRSRVPGRMEKPPCAVATV